MTTSELSSAQMAVLCAVPADSRVVCAVSGGLDSMCLLHFMTTWGRGAGFSVLAAHFHHQLRATADRDESFVRTWCEAQGVPFVSGRGDARACAAREGLSVEEAARKLRYAFLHRTAEAEGCAAILTAHHADDNAETVLLNLIRGTGVRGLAGIPQERAGLLRPFLELSRETLAAYAAAHDIPHVEDETNADPDAAARNLLRLKVLPLLRELNPRASEHIAATAVRLRAADAFLEEEARRRLTGVQARNGRVELPLSALLGAPPALRPGMLLLLLDLLGAPRKDVGSAHLEAVLAAAQETAALGGTRRIDLPGGVAGHCGRCELTLFRVPATLPRVKLENGRPLRWGRYTLTLHAGGGAETAERCTETAGKCGAAAGGDMAAAGKRMAAAGDDPAAGKKIDTQGCVVFCRRPGEAVTVGPCLPDGRLCLPETHGGRRSVKRLCMDRGISPARRDALPALYADGRLCAVWGLGVDTDFLPAGDAVWQVNIYQNTEEDDHGQ